MVAILSLVFLGFIVFSFARNEKEAAAFANVIVPVATEKLMDFDCANPPCKILGPKKNGSGVELIQRTYHPSISNLKFNGLSAVGFVVNQGDRVTIGIDVQDKSFYYLFIPRLDLAYVFSSESVMPLVLDTAKLKGDYVILIQDSLDPKVAKTNFEAAILRVE